MMLAVAVVLPEPVAVAVLRAIEGRQRPEEMPLVNEGTDLITAALEAARAEAAAAEAAGPESSGPGGL